MPLSSEGGGGKKNQGQKTNSERIGSQICPLELGKKTAKNGPKKTIADGNASIEGG